MSILTTAPDEVNEQARDKAGSNEAKSLLQSGYLQESADPQDECLHSTVLETLAYEWDVFLTTDPLRYTIDDLCRVIDGKANPHYFQGLDMRKHAMTPCTKILIKALREFYRVNFKGHFVHAELFDP